MTDKNMEKIKLGYIPLAKSNFDTEQAEKDSMEVLNLLKKYHQVDLVSGQIQTLDYEIPPVIERFKTEQIDVLMVHFCTFCLGNILPLLASNLPVPIVLLGSPEPGFEGNRLRTNSFCALNMNAHTLYKMRKKYRAVFHALNDEALFKELQVIFSALYTLKNLKNKRIGLIGSRAPGFYTSNFNELRLREELGVEVEHIDISKVYLGAEKMKEKEVAEEREKLLESVNYQSNVETRYVNKLVRSRTSIANIADEYRLDALAIKCWPEFHVDYGAPVCMALGMMSSRGLPAACEGDVYGATTMMMQKLISGQKAFFADYIFSDSNKNTGLFWHCGSAPVDLAEDKSKVLINNFSVVVKDAPEKGCVLDFEVYTKGKNITINRIGADNEENFRLLNITGKGMESDNSLRGNYCQVQFDKSLDAIRKGILENGFEHHYSLVMSDIAEVIDEIGFWKSYPVYRF